MGVLRLRIMCIEIYKATSSPSPTFMGAIFKAKMPQRRPRDKCKVIFQSYFRRKKPYSFWAKNLESSAIPNKKVSKFESI